MSLQAGPCMGFLMGGAWHGAWAQGDVVRGLVNDNGEGAIPNATYLVNLIYTRTNMKLDLQEHNLSFTKPQTITPCHAPPMQNTMHGSACL